MPRNAQEIKQDIVDLLVWDTRVVATDIEVDVNQGHVTLSGSVPSYTERVAAHENTRAVRGVATVDNALEVKHSSAKPLPTDNDIKQYIQSLLAWNTGIDHANVAVTVNTGWVTLEGHVNSYRKIVEAEELVSHITGVIGITNKLAVVPNDDVADEATARDIISVLDRNMDVDLDSLDVKVEDGIVTLSGSVYSWSAYRAAHNAAVYTYGVLGVENLLSVSHGMAQ